MLLGELSFVQTVSLNPIFVHIRLESDLIFDKVWRVYCTFYIAWESDMGKELHKIRFHMTFVIQTS